MRRTSFLLAALAAIVLAFAPGLADARLGSGFSFGSRGMRTFSAPPGTGTAPFAAPMQRSLTQPSAPSYAPSPMAPSMGYGGFGGRSPFMSGLLGGLIGAGIGGMLFGHGLFGGIHGGFGFLGLLLQIFIIVMVVRWLWRRFVGPQPMFAGAPGLFARGGPGPMPMGGGAPAGRPLAIGPPDYRAFERILQETQAAWSAHDLNRLRQATTPEMLSYFADQLAEQTSRSVQNIVADVRLEKGDLAEAWSEGSREYATVAMRFSMIDVTRDASGRTIDGSLTERVLVTEVWTFVRSPGGRWLLAAIQQAR